MPQPPADALWSSSTKKPLQTTSSSSSSSSATTTTKKTKKKKKTTRAAPGSSSEEEMDDGGPLKSRVRVLDVTKSVTKEVEYDSSRVKGLMEAVEATFGVPASRQRLICAGRMMRPSEPLSNYTLSQTTIHLFPRQAAVSPSGATTTTSDAAANSSSDAAMTGLTRRLPEDDDALARLALFDTVDADEFGDVERGGLRGDAPSAADLGSPREFLWGFVMGFLLGFIMLLYLWERSASHRQKMGILAGATAQLLVKYVHAGLLAAQPPQPQ